jgi:polyisoprenoid-binding protein YceI
LVAFSEQVYWLCFMSHLTISSAQLHHQMSDGSAPPIIHVLSDEAFDEKRIPGSKHACVYEVAFLDGVAKLVADQSSPVVVYGLSDDFGGAKLACERLAAAGYGEVRQLEGGLKAWEAAGYELEGSRTDATLPPDGKYGVDTEQSVFRWTGRNLFNQHNGRIAFKSGSLDIRSGRLQAGTVTLDMTKITCSDLKEPGMIAGLIGHLATDDFFSVGQFPEASFKLTQSQPIEAATSGGPNLALKGVLTLRGSTQPVTMHAQLTYLGGKLGLQGYFDVDRTRFGSVYGSGKIFEKLGQHVVNDKISVSFQLICSA